MLQVRHMNWCAVRCHTWCSATPGAVPHLVQCHTWCSATLGAVPHLVQCHTWCSVTPGAVSHLAQQHTRCRAAPGGASGLVLYHICCATSWLGAVFTVSTACSGAGSDIWTGEAVCKRGALLQQVHSGCRPQLICPCSFDTKPCGTVLRL